MSKEQILKRIRDLTAVDLKHKSIPELLASPAEELGELARELKIKLKTFGNSHKVTDEGPKAESVDLFISAACMCWAENKNTEHYFQNLIKNFEIQDLWPNFKIWEEFERACRNLSCCSGNTALKLAQNAINIFFKCEGTFEEFIELANKKLDKWEKTQTCNTQQ